MKSPYILDSSINVMMRLGMDFFDYSDGDVVELWLLEIIEKASNISASSPELTSAIFDWPSEYHLSSARHNLLRPFGIGPEHNVLELGCGCGAMTRYLGETGATVIAVEGSKRRAQIAAARCRDLPNVTIYCDNLIDFMCEEKFDFVTLIGVLEYAPKFIKQENPVADCLRHARSFLKEDGALMLAIENQFGLKYLNGCPEDHVGTSYYGVNDLYGDSDPVTYGRHAISELLDATGLLRQEFFYPFPDYKLPGVILSGDILADARLNVADLLIHNTGRCYPETHHRAFAENLAWRVAIRNRMLPDLANSFLILARENKDGHRKADWLAKMYNRGYRHPCYRLESTITADTTGNLVVRKQKSFPTASVLENAWLRHAIADSNYTSGNLLVGRIHDAMAREAGLDELSASFAPWLKFLIANVSKDEEGEKILPGNFVDCIPANLLETAIGELYYIDAEWVSSEPIPLSWTVMRGIFNSFIGCLENHKVAGMTYRQLIIEIARRSGVVLDEADLALAARLEQRLIDQCFLVTNGRKLFANSLDESFQGQIRLSAHIPKLRYELTAHKFELSRIKSTVSWQITKPLRLLAFLWRKIVGMY
ncbi:MAG: class I SAM-dependent methyltransferase [Candidatus Sedimenticola sp. (ex Thyasira tokunagai)]